MIFIKNYALASFLYPLLFWDTSNIDEFIPMEINETDQVVILLTM